MSSMRQLIWIGAVVALAACKVDEPAKQAAATPGGGARPAAPVVAAGSAIAAPTPGSATPAAAEEDEGTGPVPSCADAIAKGLAGFAPGPEAGGLKERFQATFTRRCTEDHWPAKVLRCYAGATSRTGMELCRGRMPPDLRAKLQAEIVGVMSGGASVTPPPGPVPVGGPPAPPAN